MADARDDHVVEPLVRAGAILAGKDPDRRSAGSLCATRSSGHDLAEPAADDRAAALGEQPPDLPGARLVLGAAAYHRHLYHCHVRRA